MSVILAADLTISYYLQREEAVIDLYTVYMRITCTEQLDLKNLGTCLKWNFVALILPCGFIMVIYVSEVLPWPRSITVYLIVPSAAGLRKQTWRLYFQPCP